MKEVQDTPTSQRGTLIEVPKEVNLVRDTTTLGTVDRDRRSKAGNDEQIIHT